jgi:hypothetical protein
MCKKEVNDAAFLKSNGEYFKLCSSCREIGRQRNNRRKEAKNLKSREYYEENKKIVDERNKKWRAENKEWLKEYESRPERKEHCKKWRDKTRQEDPCRFIFYSAKRRAKLYNLPFDLTKDDVKNAYPSDGNCPMLGIRLIINVGQTKDDSPSLDRIIPEKGYIKENIIVISHRANRIKNNATLTELDSIVSFLKRLEIK